MLLAVLLSSGGVVLAQPGSQEVAGGTDWTTYLTYDISVSSILISCLLMLALYLVLGQKKQRHRSYSYKTNYDSPMAAYGNANESEVDRLRNRIKHLEDRVSKLSEDIRALTVKVDSSKIPMEVYVAGAPDRLPEQGQKPRSERQPEPETTSQAFFLSTPNSDGSFNNSSANVSYKEGASIYKFQNIKGNRAKFRIDERDASVKLALAYPDKNIDPVCDALNAFDPRARKIFTQVPGEAELLDDRWKVITKAKIRYES